MTEESIIEEEELIVLDEYATPTGETVPRSKAHSEGILHGASHVYIYRRNSNRGIDFLLQRRSLNKDSFPGQLDMSSGGHMTKGFNFESTAVKELKEELGITINEKDLECALTQRYIPGEKIFQGKVFRDQEINRVYVLNMDVNPNKLHLQSEEVSEVIWMDSDEILRRINKGDEEFCLNPQEFNAVLEFVKRKLLSYLRVNVEPITEGKNQQEHSQGTDNIGER